MPDSKEFKTVVYTPLEEGVVRILLNRPEKRNAQNITLLYELNDAFDLAAADDSVKVIVLSGAGPHFSSGHDQKGMGPNSDIRTVGTWHGYDLPGLEGLLAHNKEIYFDLCWRWRNLPKPVIGQAQGKTIGGGLMLLFICDLIVAAEDAMFADPVVNMGVNGVEYFAHPWEFGPRKAKELLFTSDFITARDLERTGMISRVVPAAELEEATLQLARRIAQKPSLGLKMAKEAVNVMLESQGQYQALKAAFNICVMAELDFITSGKLADKKANPLFRDQLDGGPAREWAGAKG
jgi:enoyl-CoA hydratase